MKIENEEHISNPYPNDFIAQAILFVLVSNTSEALVIVVNDNDNFFLVIVINSTPIIEYFLVVVIYDGRSHRFSI